MSRSTLQNAFQAGLQPAGRSLMAAVALLVGAVGTAPSASAQERPSYDQYEPPARPAAPSARPRRDDAYRPPESNDSPAGGFGQQAGSDGRPWDGRGYSPPPSGGYAGGTTDDPRYRQPQAPPPSREFGASPSGGYGGDPRYAAPQQQPDYGRGGYGGRDDYRQPASPPGYGQQQDPRGGYAADSGGYGQPYGQTPGQYSGPGQGYEQDYGGPRPAYADQQPPSGRGGTYSQNEVVGAGHRFFGSISEGLARAVERVFANQGRPNGYILGEDAGGAFVAGLRYGEGTLHTKDVGNHRVFWQGPSLGYDFGGEGSKTMVLVYNLRDPSDIYARFGGVQGAAYVIGGVSVQFQKYEHVTLAVIRSGVGLRLGANVGYLKYTRAPTWNPF